MIRVLIVEDDPMVAQINKSYIETIEGFNIIGTAKDESEALSFIKENDIDLAIIDIFLPKGDGLNFLKTLREKNIKADVIMVTAASESDTINEALRLGAIDYLIKPFEYDRLSKTLENYKHRKNLLDSLANVDQNQLDDLLNSYSQDDIIPKGLNEKTLSRIKNYILKLDKDTFYIDNIAEGLSISKVTARKYMEYLEKTRFIMQELEYGQIGRPTYLYKILK